MGAINIPVTTSWLEGYHICLDAKPYECQQRPLSLALRWVSQKPESLPYIGQPEYGLGKLTGVHGGTGGHGGTGIYETAFMEKQAFSTAYRLFTYTTFGRSIYKGRRTTIFCRLASHICAATMIAFLIASPSEHTQPGHGATELASSVVA